MDFTSFRHSEELSDIEIILKPEDRHYSLHKFPLYTKSEYLRQLVADDPKLKTVELDNFPGGAANFERVADFCYSHYVEVKKDNVVELYLAGRYLSMHGFGNLIELTDRHLTDILASAKLSRAVGLIVGILVQCKDDLKVEIKDNKTEEKSHEKDKTVESVDYVQQIRDKCIDTIIEIWSKPPSRFPYKRDQGPNIQDLSLDTVKRIIQAGKKAEIRSEVLLNVIREYTERHLLKPVKEEPKEESLKLKLPLDPDSDDDMEVRKINGDQRSSDSSDSEDEVVEREVKEEQKPEEQNEGEDNKVEDEKQDQTIKDADEETKDDTEQERDGEPKQNTDEKIPEKPSNNKTERAEESPEDKEAREVEFTEKLDTLVMELQEKPRTLRDENSIRWIIQALEIANRKKCECRERLLYAASTVLAQIPEEELRTMTPDLVCDLLHEAGQSGFHFANTVSVITDFYILDKAKEGTLDKESFVKLATALPEGFRTNLDTLYEAYGIMAKECTPEERENILGALDLSRLSEETMGKAHDNKAIDADQLIPALINRCKRLRADLDKAKEIIKKKEAEQYLSATRSRQYYTPRETVKRSQPPATQISWPLSARWDSRYEPIKLSPSSHLQVPAGPGSLPSSPRHKTVLAKPVATKPVQVPLSARYHNEKPQKPWAPLNTGKVPRANPNRGGSLPGTPRNAWKTHQPQKVPTRDIYLTSENLPDYSSSGIGPDDVRQVYHELALTSPRLSYMYKAQYEVPERDYSAPFSPRRGQKY